RRFLLDPAEWNIKTRFEHFVDVPVDDPAHRWSVLIILRVCSEPEFLACTLRLHAFRHLVECSDDRLASNAFALSVFKEPVDPNIRPPPSRFRHERAVLVCKAPLQICHSRFS